VTIAIEGNSLLVAGRRSLPAKFKQAAIHRLELPQGRFERHIPLPAGRYRSLSRANESGCLVVMLHKAE
jgi:HSP20 family molecular chaperone IbpA